MKILIAGGTGYTGRHLVERFIEEGRVSLKLLEWDPRRAGDELGKGIEIINGNTEDKGVMDEACHGVHTAYYLVNFIDTDPALEKLNLKIARRFRNACVKNRVKRIIYCSDLPASASSPGINQSRKKIADVLQKYPDKIQTIWIRHGIIIGAGSLDFEILNSLAERRRILIFKWMSQRAAVTGIDDLSEILKLSLGRKLKGNLKIDMYSGAASYDEMLKMIEKEKNISRKRKYLHYNYSPAASLYLTICTPVHFSVAGELISRISSPIRKGEKVKNFFPKVTFHSIEDAVRKALKDVEERIESGRWCDCYSGSNCRFEDESAIPSNALYDRREVSFSGLSSEAVFSSVMDTGGTKGWFSYTFLWQIRGLIDKFAGGYGLNRGKRNSRKFRVGDSIDVWRVADLEENKRLLLYAHMKLPGRGWLEFIVKESSLIQTAYFEPYGIKGRIYWIMMLPFHGLIFKDMARKIIERAG
ncbi:MAG TPA: SDR family oxidoreductase [Spirochaetota bacterium]|nr:SDR family oxidoreductase [Spirochaetota bacterium]